MKVLNINIDKVPQFSERDRQFLLDNKTLRPFQQYDSEYETLKQVIADRAQHPCNRDLLTKVLEDQYAGVKSSHKTSQLLKELSGDNSYTIVTAHQPSLLTGPLYYVFKILSAIKLVDRLRRDYPTKTFVPVFIIGSEDHDFEEVNHFHLYGKKLEWSPSTQGGAVGNYKIDELEPVISQVLEVLGPTSKATDLLEQLKAILPSCRDYNDFAFRLTHLLFDHLGLVILRMNHAELKRAFIPLIKEEILNRPSKDLVTTAQEQIKATLGFDSQAFPRDINFFYLSEQSRNRIEFQDGLYRIVNTTRTFTEAELLAELEKHPEKFSPNVVMRPIYQEFILPNLAYIGGGGELAYWTERKTQFEHYKVPFPMLIRRTSGMIVTPSSQKQIDKLGFSLEQLFSKEQLLIKTLIDNSDNPDYELSSYRDQVTQLFESLAEQVAKIDVTLEKTTKSELAKTVKSIDYLESKLKKAIKQKESVSINRINKLKTQLFPKGLQERHDNIFQYISMYGPELIEQLYDYCDPFDKKMKVFLMS